MEIHDNRVEDPKDRVLGCMVGTADLIGQMSDRLYLEKCREFLYKEFVLGSIARDTLADGREIVRYASPDDLIIKTPGFYEYVARARIDLKLGGVDRFASAHFDGAKPLAFPDVNAAFEAFSRSRESEALGRSPAALLFRGDETLVQRLLAESPRRWELTAWTKDGDLRHVEVALSPLRSADGRLTHW